MGFGSGEVGFLSGFKDKSGGAAKRLMGFHEGAVNCLTWLPHNVGGFASGGMDGNVRVWDTATNRCKYIFVGKSALL